MGPYSTIVSEVGLVDQVMSTEPYASARCVYWIVDNGSSHRGQASIKRLEGRYLKEGHRRLRLIHCPVHASWLNQIEIFFSIVQRKVLTPTTSQTSTRSSSDCWPSSATTRRRLGPSSGDSRVRTSLTS